MIGLLIGDHRRIEERLLELERTSDPAERRRLTDLLVVECVRHSVAEEVYLHPIVEKALPRGADRIAEEVRDHAWIEERLEELERMDMAGRGFKALVTSLRAETHQHVVNEELSLFTWVEQYTDPLASVDAGDRMKALENTDPHVPGGPGLAGRVRRSLAMTWPDVNLGCTRSANDGWLK